MDENLFHNNPEFKSLSRFVVRITRGNQKIEKIKLDDILKLRSLVDQAISKLKNIYNNPQHQDFAISNKNDETENENQKSAVSLFSLITQSLYILSHHLAHRKYSNGSDDELIINLHSQNERLAKQNRLLKSKLNGTFTPQQQNEESNGEENEEINYEPEDLQQVNNPSASSNDNTDDLLQYVGNYTDAQSEDLMGTIFTRICQKLKLKKIVNNENEFIRLLYIEINKPKKIKQEIIRHYKLNFDDQNYVSLSDIVQALDKHIKSEMDNHDDLRGELSEATESLTQLKNELEYITKSVLKKDDKISQLRRERNDARQQLNELLQTIKQSNYNTSHSINNDQDRSENEHNAKDDEKELELQELRNQLQKAQTTLMKKNQKIEKMKQKIETLEEKEFVAAMNKQSAIISNLTNSMDNIEATLNKSQSQIDTRSILNGSPTNKADEKKNEDNLFDMKKELINLKDLLSQRDEQITNLKSFVSDIASQYEAASNELSEESKNKFELARCVQILLDANKTLETLLETSNLQKEKLKTQLDNSIFKAQNNTNLNNNSLSNATINTNINDVELKEFPINSDQLLLQKMKKMTDEVFNKEENQDENQISSKINKILSDNQSLVPQNNSESVLEIFKLILDFISSQKNKLNNSNIDLNEERSFSYRLYCACLGQLRFILDLSDSRMMQKWIFGNENEEWIRQSLQRQAARMESFFDNYIESYNEHKNRNEAIFAQSEENDNKENLNPIQQIEKGIFEELLPLSKSSMNETKDNTSSTDNSTSNTTNNSNVKHALMIPLSTRITEYLENYKEKMAFDQMTGEKKDLYLMLVQCIAANNILQIFATEEGNQCKSQLNEIRNLQTQLSMLNRSSYTNTNSNSNQAVSDDKSESNNNNNENENEVKEVVVVDDDNFEADDEEIPPIRKKTKKNRNEMNPPIGNNDNNSNGNNDASAAYKEIKNIKNILRKTVSKIINSSNKKGSNPNNSIDESERNKNPPHSDLFICLKCIEKADKVSLDKDRYVRKLEKKLVKCESKNKSTNDQILAIKKEMSFLKNECQNRINEYEEAVKKLTQNLTCRENELKVLKESILMLNFGDNSVIDEVKQQSQATATSNETSQFSSNYEDDKNESEVTQPTTSPNDNKNEEEDNNDNDNDNDDNNLNIGSNREQFYEEIANKLSNEVDLLQQKVAKMSKARKNQSKLLSTINFLTNQKKEIEEEQQKEREVYQTSLDQLQNENSQLTQKLNDLNDSILQIRDKFSKIQIENKLLKSRLKNEEEKSEREKSLIESRMKLKAFSIENAMKDKIEEAKQQQQNKQKELVVYIYNLFSTEVDLLMKNEETEKETANLLSNKETEDSIYSFLQSIKTKMSRLERSSFACDSTINELNEIRRILENFISENRNKINSDFFDDLDLNGKCSRIIKEILDAFSLKIAKLQKQENELKQLKLDSLNASKVIEKAKEAVEWDNWSKRVQRFITDGFEVKPLTLQQNAPPISPSQVLAPKSNNLILVSKIPSSKDVRNKLEEAIYSALSGNTIKLIRKLEILRTEKKILTAFHLCNLAHQCLFVPANNRLNNRLNYRYNNNDNSVGVDDPAVVVGRSSNISMRHLILISIIAKRVEKLSGHVPSFVMKRNFEPGLNGGGDDKRATKPIFSQFISPL